MSTIAIIDHIDKLIREYLAIGVVAYLLLPLARSLLHQIVIILMLYLHRPELGGRDDPRSKGEGDNDV